MEKKLLAVSILCLFLLVGCQSPKTELKIVNSSTKVITEVYVASENILSYKERIQPGQSWVTECIPNNYDITIACIDYRWLFDSIQIRSGHRTTLIVQDPQYGDPPPPVVEENPSTINRFFGFSPVPPRITESEEPPNGGPGQPRQ